MDVSSMPRKFQKRKPQKRRPRNYKKKFAPRKQVLKTSAEIFQCRLAPRSINAQAVVASAQNGPLNSTLILPSFFNQHSLYTDSEGTAYTGRGCWVVPKWLTTKLRISFDKIVPESEKSKEGFNVRVVVGRLCSTGSKFGASNTNAASFETSVLTELKKQLYDADMSSDYLAFEKKTRNIKIDQEFKVIPSRDRSIRMAFHNGSGHVAYSCPPPQEYTIKHKIPTTKTKLDNHTAAHPLPMNQWVPFIMITCAELHAPYTDEHGAHLPGTGYLACDYSSRGYFTDV